MEDKVIRKLTQAIGDFCHQKYMGCQKSRNTGVTNYDWDYSYTDEVVNMVGDFFKTDEGKKLIAVLQYRQTLVAKRSLYENIFKDYKNSGFNEEDFVAKRVHQIDKQLEEL